MGMSYKDNDMQTLTVYNDVVTSRCCHQMKRITLPVHFDATRAMVTGLAYHYCLVIPKHQVYHKHLKGTWYQVKH